MHNAENRTVAKSLPLLRRNSHKLLILSYSEYFGRILIQNVLIAIKLSLRVIAALSFYFNWIFASVSLLFPSFSLILQRKLYNRYM